MVGVNGAETASQLNFVKECCSPELIERQKRGSIYSRACAKNGEPGYGPIEADFLFSFISSTRPQRIVQVGCGVSTAVMLQAAEEAGYAPEMVCVDPYPTCFLEEADHSKRIKLIREKAQRVGMETLTDLGDNGLLFMDSTHTVKPGSEVNRIVLEVLPRLKKGSWAHFHDIRFPYDYSRHILGADLFFNNESVLLHAFLVHNQRYSLRAALSMLHYAAPSELQKFLPNYRPSRDEFGLEVSEGHFPSSAYLQVIE